VPKLILRYPDGAAGAALLLLRFSSAAIAWPTLARLLPTPAGWWFAASGAAILILALATGFGTRAAALLLATALVAGLLAARGETALLLLASAGGATALALLGPGAWSIDAHRYGHRVIHLDPRSPDRGGRA
jgi:uncharacterized membrane protein YphA (DoxX/SURF4 family)